jgi:hypothetical protein
VVSSDVIDVALGLSFVYLVFSLLASRINEYVASKLQWRAQGLSQGLAALVGLPAPEPVRSTTKAASAIAKRLRPITPDVPMATPVANPLLSGVKVKGHPLVRAMEQAVGNRRASSYLSADTFASAVTDLLSGPASNAATDPSSPKGLQMVDLLKQIKWESLSDAAKEAFAALREEFSASRLDALEAKVESADSATLAILVRARALLPDVLDRVRGSLTQLEQENNPAAEVVRYLLDSTGGDLQRFEQKLAEWFDHAMDRVSGWYKRRVSMWIAIYGLVLVVVFNVDSVGIADSLWLSPVQRNVVATAAASQAKGKLPEVDTTVRDLKSLSLPLGWDFSGSPSSTGPAAAKDDPARSLPSSFKGWLAKLLGFAVSVGALTLGAPFWFDALGKLSNLRGAGKVPPPAA